MGADEAGKAGMRLMEQASQNMARMQAGVHFEPLANVAVDGGFSVPRSSIEHQRSLQCHMCRMASTATSYSCPVCFASVCYKCTKCNLERTLRCPACGDSNRNREALQEYLQAGDAFSAIGNIGGTIRGGIGSALEGIGSSTASALSWHVEPLSRGVSRKMTGFSDAAETIGSIQVVSSDSCIVPDAARLHKCQLCSRDSSWNDHACPRCSTTVCATCICTRLAEDLRCPHCGEAETNGRAMRFILNANHASELVGSLWTLGSRMLTGETAPEGRPRAATAFQHHQYQSPVKHRAATAPVGHLPTPFDTTVVDEDTSRAPQVMQYSSPSRRHDSEYVTL